MPDQPTEIIVGVDTHTDTHAAVAIDALGHRIDVIEISANAAGYRQLLNWARQLGELRCVGIEGTGSYGAGLARYLSGADITVLEVNRTNRQHRHRYGKSDPADAEGAARAVLAGEAGGVPKSHIGIVESIRALHVVKRSAIKARTQAANQLASLIISAPEATREELRRLPSDDRARRAAAWRPGAGHDPATVTRRAIRSLARRWLQLTEEIDALAAELDVLVHLAAPGLMAEQGIGRDVAAKLLIAAGDNPERLRSEAAFAALCGTNPISASSGKTNRHRLNRGGDRQANNALWTIVMVRMRRDAATRAYVERRQAEGLSRREIMRCLKRYLARQLHPILLADLAALT
jgi:transposase